MLIYVVEDDTSILKLIEYSLRSKGYDVYCFENGNDFFEKLSEKKPDIVLLDIMLPDIEGTEILTKLKEKEDTKNIWVMMITAKTSEYDIISALDGGADDYIKKPFSVMELLSRVGAIARRATNSVDMHIKLLRDKLKDKRNYIKTIRGVGYMLSTKDWYEK